LQPALLPSRPFPVVGFAAGALGSLTAMPGALVVVWCELRGLSKESQRALVQPFIIAVQVFAIGLYCLQPHAIGFDLSQLVPNRPISFQ